MMKMTDVFKPSILLSETHFSYRNIGGVIAGAVERIADEGFFRGIEIPDCSGFGYGSQCSKTLSTSDLTQKKKLLIV